MSFENGLVVAVSQFPLWKCTTNGSIQCFYNFVTSKYNPDRLLWLILSELDIDVNNPNKANANLVLNNKHRNVYVQNVDHPETAQIVIDFLKSQPKVTEIITLDIVPGVWGLEIRQHLPDIRVWTHLCTLHYSKNVKVLIDDSIISDTKSYDTFFINEIEIAKHATLYVTVSQSESEWIKTIVPKVNPMIYYPTRSWWSNMMVPRISAQQTLRCNNISYIRELNPDKLLMLYVGRITHQKGIQKLLNVNIPSNIHVVVMSSTSFGDEGLLQNIQTVAKLRPDLLSWIGPHYHEDKIQIMQQCDAVICPSVFEPFGLVGLETLLFTETLLIASGVDGMQDYTIDGGFLKCGTSVQSIQDAIATFSSMPTETRRKISQKGRIHAENCINCWSQPGLLSQLTIPSLPKQLPPRVSLPLPPISKIDKPLVD